MLIQKYWTFTNYGPDAQVLIFSSNFIWNWKTALVYLKLIIFLIKLKHQIF